MTGKQILSQPAVYPPVPWVCSGGMWFGIFRSDDAPTLPDDLQPLLGRGWLTIVLVRYLRGPLHYDELIVGAPARRGARGGLYVHHIWVNSVPSLWGGRRIWGLPKQLATFHWQVGTVHISDEWGQIATLRINVRIAWLPRVPILAPGFGDLDGQRVFALARGTARLGRSGMWVHMWSQRFPYRPPLGPLPGLAAKPFSLTIPTPSTLGLAP